MVELISTDGRTDRPYSAAGTAFGQREYDGPGDAPWRDMNMRGRADNIGAHNGGFHQPGCRVDHHDAGGGGNAVHRRHFLAADERCGKDVIGYGVIDRIHLVHVGIGRRGVDGIAVAAAACQHDQRQQSDPPAGESL